MACYCRGMKIYSLSSDDRPGEKLTGKHVVHGSAVTIYKGGRMDFLRLGEV